MSFLEDIKKPIKKSSKQYACTKKKTIEEQNPNYVSIVKCTACNYLPLCRIFSWWTNNGTTAGKLSHKYIGCIIYGYSNKSHLKWSSNYGLHEKAKKKRTDSVSVCMCTRDRVKEIKNEKKQQKAYIRPAKANVFISLTWIFMPFYVDYSSRQTSSKWHQMEWK